MYQTVFDYVVFYLRVPQSVWISAQFSWFSVTWTLITDPPVDSSVIV